VENGKIFFIGKFFFIWKLDHPNPSATGSPNTIVFPPFRQITSTSYFSGRNGFLPDFEVSTMAVTDRPTGGGLNDQTMLNFAHG
jgi:hypothetical protein